MNRIEADRTADIFEGCLAEAKDQLGELQTMIDNCDGKDIQALAVAALAAENTAETVRKFYRLNLQLNRELAAHGLA